MRRKFAPRCKTTSATDKRFAFHAISLSLSRNIERGFALRFLSDSTVLSTHILSASDITVMPPFTLAAARLVLDFANDANKFNAPRQAPSFRSAYVSHDEIGRVDEPKSRRRDLIELSFR
jgi:hypothetical protein